MGRKQLYISELRRMITAENIEAAYHSRKRSDNWAKWANENPELEKLLIEAELLCQ